MKENGTKGKLLQSYKLEEWWLKELLLWDQRAKYCVLEGHCGAGTVIGRLWVVMNIFQLELI
jgi:hypothetical protein